MVTAVLSKSPSSRRVGTEDVGAQRADLGDVGQEESGHVEVVNRHVAEDPPGLGEVGTGRDARITADDAEVLEVADLARVNARTCGGEVSIESSVESQRDGHRRRSDLGTQGVDVRNVEIDRLLAKRGNAGVDRVGDQAHVRRRRRCNDDGVDLARREHGGGVGADPSSVLRGDPLGAFDDRVADPGELGAWVCRDTRGVHLTDATGSDEPESYGCAHELLLERDGESDCTPMQTL